MPPKMRALLNLVVIVIAIGVWLARDAIGMAASPWLFFGLLAFITFSIWLFPEVKNKPD